MSVFEFAVLQADRLCLQLHKVYLLCRESVHRLILFLDIRSILGMCSGHKEEEFGQLDTARIHLLLESLDRSILLEPIQNSPKILQEFECNIN